MKLVVAVCMSLFALVGANAAVAGSFDRELGLRFFAQFQQSPRPEPQRDAARPEPQRDLRGPGESDRGRMSPDERRQLRRDIQDAGKDIYHRDRPPPNRREHRR